MKQRSILFLAAIALFTYSCQHNTTGSGGDITISPESGTAYKSGDAVSISVHNSSGSKPDSIVYLVDSVRIGSKKDSTAFSFKTDTMALGARLITAKMYQSGKAQDISTNIVLMAAKAPEELTYTVVKKYPHDTSSYTEGLLYQDGYLFESAGRYKVSTLRKVDLNTGKATQVAKVDGKYFGEGISIVGDKIVQLTYREKVGLVYDKNTFKLLNIFNNNVGVEGWGMCFDGKKLYMDDSTNRIFFLDKNTYRQTGFIDVYDDKGPIQQVNELEYIDGKLYANVYTTDNILVIDPKTGAVLQRVNMANLWPISQRPSGFDSEDCVLNGIAWDAKGKRLFVTGKKWPYLYEVKFNKK
jgi:glutamine cyclotransferase